jgi:excisionase family DNA binding protein
VALPLSSQNTVGASPTVLASAPASAAEAGDSVVDGGARMERPTGDVLTASEVSRLLRVNVKTVYENAKAGTIPCVRLGRHFRFSRRAIMARLEQCKSAPSWKGH